jgi:probable F420-dependent oxidoreductase
MNFWLPWISEAAEQTIAVAKQAELMGFTGIMVGDHIAVPENYPSQHPSGRRMFEADTPFLDPLCTISAMAGATTALQFASYVYVLPLRDPLTAAKQIGSAAILSEYRFTLGVGAGWLREEFTLMGVDPSARGQRMDEMLEILQKFWRDGTAEYHGEVFDIPRCGVYPVPTQPVPIWVGGKSAAALQRAVKYDGWVGMNYALTEVENLLAQLQSYRSHLAMDKTDPMRVFVVANERQNQALYDKLAALGVTDTLAMPWPPGSPDFLSLSAKLDAMQSFSEKYLS